MPGKVGALPHPGQGPELPVAGDKQLVMLQGERVAQGQQHGFLTLAVLECAHLHGPCLGSDLMWTQGTEEELTKAARGRPEMQDQLEEAHGLASSPGEEPVLCTSGHSCINNCSGPWEGERRA